MGIRIFIYILLAISIGGYYYQVDLFHKKVQKSNLPLVTFDDAILYNIDEENLKKIIQSKKADFYKQKKEFVDTTIYQRSIDKNNEILNEVLSANYILEQNNNFYKLIGDVKYSKNSNITLSSDELFYEANKKILYNDNNFTLIYNENKFNGISFFYNLNKGIFKANQIHFEILTKFN
jgi:LPS export ABC transporter protein LptC